MQRPVVEGEGTAVDEGAAAGRRRERGGRRGAGVARRRQRRSNVSVEWVALGGADHPVATGVRRRRRASVSSVDMNVLNVRVRLTVEGRCKTADTFGDRGRLPSQ